MEAALRSSSPCTPTPRMRRLHAARRVEALQENTICCAMPAPFYCDEPEGKSAALAMGGGRKKQRCPRHKQRIPSAILIGGRKKRRCLQQQRRTSDSSTILVSEARVSRAQKFSSGNSARPLLDFMSCSVVLGVMPHSATSRASGDDTSSIMSWNWGA